MKTEDRPERTMAIRMFVRLAIGKLRAMFSADQSSISNVATMRTGIESKLL